MYFRKIPVCFLLIFLTLAIISHHSNAQSTPTDFLNAHNTDRAQVGVGSMTWNTTLANYAFNYAHSKIVDCSLISSGGPYGENLAKNNPLTGIQAVSLWVAENSYYDYASNTCAAGKVCSHYSQVVWANSVQLGCARVVCNNGSGYVVCTYAPKGNIPGERPY